MTKKFLQVLLSVFLFAIIFSPVANAEVVTRLDGSGDAEMPRNFRVITENFEVPEGELKPSTKGMENLRVSASGQFSRPGFEILAGQLKKIFPAKSKIYIVDLRQESHGFADDFPLSFYEQYNMMNVGKTGAEIVREESELLKNLVGNRTTLVPLGNYDKANYEPVTLTPKKVFTEKEIVKAAGLNYVRFFAQDMVKPAPEVVDEFLKFVSRLPKNAALHFHCQAGQGRTTTFLLMYDVWKNPDVPLEDIARRQKFSGGSELLTLSDGNNFYAESHNERAKMIRNFYEYVQEFKSGKTSLTWSAWSSSR